MDRKQLWGWHPPLAVGYKLLEAENGSRQQIHAFFFFIALLQINLFFFKKEAENTKKIKKKQKNQKKLILIWNIT